MKKQIRNILKRIFCLTMALSLCMSLLTGMANADEPGEDDLTANIELILPVSTGNSKENALTSEGSQDEGPGNPEVVSETTKDAEIPADGVANDSTVPDGSENEESTDDNQIEKPADEQKNNGEVDLANEVEVQSGNRQSDGDVAKTQPLNDEEIVRSDKGTTSDGYDWELTMDATTGKYTLTIKLPNDSDESLNITEEDLKNIEKYAAEVSAALAEIYGTTWEWDSTTAPSGSEDVHMFQIFLTGTGNKDHTYRYDSEKLEQMDGEFILEKVDEYGNVITDSETTFQLWHINEIIDPETSEKVEVKMYCSYDPETNTYTFIPTESTIQTINGRLEILYAMMKDTVYYLQEVQAPSGYELDPDIHIIMEKDMWESKPQSFRDQFSYLGEFTEDENGRIALDVKFVDVKRSAGDYVSEVTPTPSVLPDPENIDTPDNYPIPNEPSVDDHEMPINPDSDIVHQDPPVTDTENVPVPGTSEQPTPEPVNPIGIPKTGDMMNTFILVAILSAVGLAVVSFSGRRKTEQ